MSFIRHESESALIAILRFPTDLRFYRSSAFQDVTLLFLRFWQSDPSW